MNVSTRCQHHAAAMGPIRQRESDRSVLTAITPLYIPSLQPLQLCSKSSSNKRSCSLLAPLPSPSKRVSAGRTLRCCRQLFSGDVSTRVAAMEFWLDTMEKVSLLNNSNPPLLQLLS